MYKPGWKSCKHTLTEACCCQYWTPQLHIGSTGQCWLPKQAGDHWSVSVLEGRMHSSLETKCQKQHLISTSLFKLASHFRWWDGGRTGQERERECVCVSERKRGCVCKRERERTKICFLQIRMTQFKETIRHFACWHIFNNAGTFSE